MKQLIINDDIELRTITKKSSDVARMKKLFLNAFPKVGRIPMWFLFIRANKNTINLLGIYNKGEFIGAMYLVIKKDITFVLYFTVEQAMRGKGYGRIALELVKQLKPNNRVILNIEQTNEKSENYDVRMKRKSFYLKNGFKETELQIIASGEYYEILLNEGKVTIKEFCDLVKELSSWLIYPFIGTKVIKIKS